MLIFTITIQIVMSIFDDDIDGRNCFVLLLLLPLLVMAGLMFFMLLRLAETGELGAEFDLEERDLLFEFSCLIIKCVPLLVILLFVLPLRDVFELLRLRFS